MIDRYTWKGGNEAMLRFGPDSGPVVIAALPLFEEANRTRSFTVTLLRQLARLGIGSVLPDLPGQGESLVPTEAASVADMRQAFAELAARCLRDGRPTFSAAVRSGAILDGAATLSGRWHFAPQAGSELVRELERIATAAARESGESPAKLAGQAPIEIAGNRMSPQLQAELLAPPWQPGTASRTVRLDGDSAPADLKVPGAPLWRRAEPDNDLALAASLAEDIAAWTRVCEG